MEVDAKLSAMAKVRVEEMLCIRKLKKRDAELSELLRCSEANLEKSMNNLWHESKACRDAVKKGQDLEERNTQLENSLAEQRNQIHSYTKEQTALKKQCGQLEDRVKSLQEENTNLKFNLLQSEKRIAEQSLEVMGDCSSLQYLCKQQNEHSVVY